MYKSVLLAISITCIALPASAAPLPAGTRAPDFTRTTLDGKPLSLAAAHGKLVLLDFWASWCAPCLVEMPHLAALQKSHAGKLQVIGIAMDDNKSNAADALKRFPVNYPVAMGDTGLAKLYGGILGLPEVYIIGRGGRIVKSWRGDFKPAELDQAIQTALRR